MHLLCGDADLPMPAPQNPEMSTIEAGDSKRIVALEAEVANLRSQLNDLRRQFTSLKAQLE